MFTEEELIQFVYRDRYGDNREETLRKPYPRGIEKCQMNFRVPERRDIVGYAASKLGITPDQLKAYQKCLSSKALERFLQPGEQAQLVDVMGMNYNYREEVEWTNPVQHLFWKIENSAWRWGYGRLTWRQTARFYRFLQEFDFGPEFEVTVDYTLGCNEHGPAWLQRKIEGHCYVGKTMYLDGTIGLFVWHKGQHVLTIGVSPSAQGLLINQVQLAEKRGNRWLYKLDWPYFEYAVRRVFECARRHRIPVLLIRGSFATDMISRSYGDSEARGDFDAQRGRIEALYDQEFQTLRRENPRNRWRGKFDRIRTLSRV